jgi:hypothetical protein
MKAKPATNTAAFAIGDHVTVTNAQTDDCSATGIIEEIAKGWYRVRLDAPEIFEKSKNGCVSARVSSLAAYSMAAAVELAGADLDEDEESDESDDDLEDEESDESDDDLEDEESDESDDDLEDEAPCSMAEQLRRARVRYVKTKRPSGAGSMDNGDTIAKNLRDFEPEEVMTIADRVCEESAGFHATKYDGLNPGQKRMNSGNKIRSRWMKAWKENNKDEIIRIAAIVAVALPDGFGEEVEEVEA